MDVLLVLVSSFFIIGASGLTIFYYFYLKNWLFLRVLADFYYEQGRRLWFNKKDLVLIFLGLLSYLGRSFISNAFLIITFIFLGLVFLFLRRGLFKRIRVTPKGLVIFSFYTLLNVIFLLPLKSKPYLVFLWALSPLQIFIFAFACLMVEILIKPYLFFLGQKVKNKLKGTKIKKIVIVGSYGKSTTKEILTRLLESKFKVLTPPPRINHEYALLKFLLKQDLTNFDFLILEVGSFFKGNVEWLTKRIIPDYVFITGITPQHYFLFGEKIRNVVQAEGVEALKGMKEGKVFLNTNHEYFKELLEEVEKETRQKNIEIITYGTQGDYSYEIIEFSLEEAKFIFKAKGEEIVLKTKLIFPMQIENLIAGLAFLKEENLFDEKTLETVQNLELPEGFLKVKKISNKIYLFDDSYNANPRGVIQGLKFFENLELEAKVVIFNGLWELGKETKKIFKELKEMFEKFEMIIFTSSNFYNFLKDLKNGRLIESKEEGQKLIKELEEKFEKIGVWVINRFPEKFKNFWQNND